MLGMIEVAVGLVFVYYLLSILVSQTNTVIISLLQTRAKNLRDEMVILLTDPEIQQQVLTHPLINIVKDDAAQAKRSLFRGMTSRLDAFLRRTFPNAESSEMIQRDVNDITHVDPDTFSKVLTSIITEKADLSIYGPLLDAIDKLPESPTKVHLLDMTFALQSTGQGLLDLTTLIETLPADQQPPLLTALQPVQERYKSGAPTNTNSRLLPVLDGLHRINDEAFRKALEVLLTSAKTTDDVEASIAKWFDERMGQLSALYKNKMTYLSALLGLILVLALNVDTLQIAHTLWADPSLRQAVAQQAQITVNQVTATQEPLSLPAATAEPGALSAQAAATPEPGSASPGQAAAAAGQQASETLNQLTALNLPIGWQFTPISGDRPCFQASSAPDQCSDQGNLWLMLPGNNPDWLSLLVSKFVGLLITTLAVAQGAPFWFDLLRKLVRS